MNVAELTPKMKTILEPNLGLTFLDKLEDHISLDGQDYIKDIQSCPIDLVTGHCQCHILDLTGSISDVYSAAH